MKDMPETRPLVENPPPALRNEVQSRERSDIEKSTENPPVVTPQPPASALAAHLEMTVPHAAVPKAEAPKAEAPKTEAPHTALPTLTPERVQEVDAWWGSYSGWTMMPSMAVCMGLTALIAWGSWQLLESKGWVQLSILSLTAALWLVQAFRWCYRVFGYNYRLTTHRLFQGRGLLYAEGIEVRLATVSRVDVQRAPHEIVAGVGKVCLTLDDPTRARVILQGVANPRQVAEHIQQLSEKARERQVTAARV